MQIPVTCSRWQECHISHKEPVIPATIVFQVIACQHRSHEFGCEVWQGHLNTTEKKYTRSVLYAVF